MDESIPQKYCPKCQQWKPATLEYFHAQKQATDGLRVPCKPCRSIARPSDVQPGFKRCSKCRQEFPATLEYFNAHTRRKGGLFSQCKSCRSVARAASEKRQRQANPEKRRQYQREWYQLNIEKERERDRLYRETHRELLREQRKRQYHANSEREREKVKRYRLRYPERVRRTQVQYNAQERVKEKHRLRARTHREQRRVIQQRRVARKLAATGSHTAQDVQRQLAAQNNLCYYCSKHLDVYQVDHIIPLSRGGSDAPENLVIACPPCNRKKHNKLPHEWSEGGKLL